MKIFTKKVMALIKLNDLFNIKLNNKILKNEKKQYISVIAKGSSNFFNYYRNLHSFLFVNYSYLITNIDNNTNIHFLNL